MVFSFSQAFVLTIQPIWAILVPTESSQRVDPYRLGFILTFCLLSLYFRTSLRRKVITSKDVFFQNIFSEEDFLRNRHSETEKIHRLTKHVTFKDVNCAWIKTWKQRR